MIRRLDSDDGSALESDVNKWRSDRRQKSKVDSTLVNDIITPQSATSQNIMVGSTPVK